MTDKQKKLLFPKMESTGELVQMFRTALRRAAGEAYQKEMVDTYMHVCKIQEEAEKYEYYTDEDSRQDAIDNCQWATKEDWIKDKMDEWLEKE